MLEVAAHYTHGALEEAILRALTEAGKDTDRLTVEDLAPFDEFHVGGREATQEFALHMDLRQGLEVLDIGCGIGGPARFIASTQGCRVTGIDLTEEFMQVGRSLTGRAGLGEQVHFCRASALALPLRHSSFDRAYMIHAGMNIGDKASVFAEAARVLRPGGLFGLYEIAGEGPLQFPLPWADTPGISFVAPLSAYRNGLEAAGFSIEAERDRREYALEFFARARPAGLRPVMGRNAGEKIANLTAAVSAGSIRPVEWIARKR